MILRRRPSPLEMFGQTKFDEGYEKGERCNRMNDNTTFHCLGIIDELESDDSCTCHTGHPSRDEGEYRASSGRSACRSRRIRR